MIKKASILLLGFLLFQHTLIAQDCNGHWVNNRPFSFHCISGQIIGPSTCCACGPNPSYSGTEINTFIFDAPVNDFFIDFNAFDAPSVNCSRMEIKINGIFFPLTAANLSELPLGNNCTGSASNLMITPDGYLTNAVTSSTGYGQGRLLFTGVNASSITISTNDGGTGSIFTNPCVSATVPITLKYFKAIQANNCKAIVSWESEIEYDLKSLEVEGSTNGIEFNRIASLAPTGNNSYYQIETDIKNENLFLRLKSIDLDGKFEYSKIIFLKSSCPKNGYTVRPNPAGSFIEVPQLIKNDKIEILDILGVQHASFNFEQSNIFNIQKLPAGTYFLRIIHSGAVKTILKFIKV